MILFIGKRATNQPLHHPPKVRTPIATAIAIGEVSPTNLIPIQYLVDTCIHLRLTNNLKFRQDQKDIQAAISGYETK